MELFQNICNTIAFAFMSKEWETRPSEFSGRLPYPTCCWRLDLGISLASNSDFTFELFSFFRVQDCQFFNVLFRTTPG